MIENIFVIFAPGHGGNHLANILSMSDRHQQRFGNSVYTESAGPHAHPNSTASNYNPTETTLRSLQNQSNVFCCHFTEYLTSRLLTEQFLDNRKYVMIEFPPHNRNKLFQQRIAYWSYYQDAYILEELSTLYSLNSFSKLTNETDLAKVTVDLLFTEDISKLLNTLTQEFGLIFDHTAVDRFHQLWLKKNIVFQENNPR